VFFRHIATNTQENRSQMWSRYAPRRTLGATRPPVL
jgi:hypothetical protein